MRDWIRGYQIRSMPGELFVRISTQAMKEGLSFSEVGRALNALVRTRCPRIAKVEIAFITSSSDAVQGLYKLRQDVMEVSHNVRREVMAEVGIDIDCPSGGHCGNCKDKATCIQVRHIQAMREQRKQST